MSTSYYFGRKVEQQELLAALVGSRLEVVVPAKPVYVCWHRAIRCDGVSVWALDSHGYVEFELFLPQVTRGGIQILQRVAELLHCPLLHEHFEDMITAEGEIKTRPDTLWSKEDLALWDQSYLYRRDSLARNDGGEP